jgi:hypothetical protein
MSLAQIVGWLANELEIITEENREKYQVSCFVRDSKSTSEYSSDMLHLSQLIL